MRINWTIELKDTKKTIFNGKMYFINQVSTILDYDFLILIGLFLIQFKLNNASKSYWLSKGFMVKLHAPNLIQN